MSEGTTPQPPEERRPGGEPGYGQGWGTPPPSGGGGYGGPPPGQRNGPGWSGQRGGGSGGTGGIDSNLASGLSYVLTFVTGAVFLIIDRRPEVRFHAMQSILFGGAWLVVAILRSVLSFFPLNVVLWLAWLTGLVLWVVLMIQGFQGRHFKLPYLGDIAEQQESRS